MSGYDRSRFVDIRTEDLEEFVCAICLDVFNSPLSTRCCGQTYCGHCVTQWQSQHNTCPNDRKPLTRDQLTPAPRIVVNLLNNLKIGCVYAHNGCDQVCRLEDLANHVAECRYNHDKACALCKNTHDYDNVDVCRQNLVAEIGKFASKLQLADNARDQYKAQCELLFAENANLSKRLEAITRRSKPSAPTVPAVPSAPPLPPAPLRPAPLAPPQQSPIQWVPCTNKSKIPVNTIESCVNDHDKQLVARASHNEMTIVGFYSKSDKLCHIPAKTKEYKYKKFEVLTVADNCSINWVKHDIYNPTILYGAVQGGQEGNLPHFVGRGKCGNKWRIGKVMFAPWCRHWILYSALNGQEIALGDFEFLCV